MIGAYCISKAADMQLARNLAAGSGRQHPHQHHRPGLVRTDSPNALWDDPAYLEKRLR